MGKLLRVLIIIIFLLGAASLTLAYLLFEKRLEFKGRLDIWETMLPKIAAWFAQDNPPDTPTPQWEARDIDDVTSRVIATPNRSMFWDGYKYPLEMDGASDTLMSLTGDNFTRQFRSLYLMEDDANGNPARVKDDIRGGYKTTGPGTMQQLLDDIRARAQAQYTTLVNTRAQLTALRKEYQDTVNNLNNVKAQGRRDKQTIDNLNERINRLEDEKTALERRIRELDATIVELNNEIKEKKEEIAWWEDEFNKLKLTTEQYAERIKVLEKIIRDTDPRGRDPGSGIFDDEELRKLIDAGDKGTVVGVESTFVILKLDESFTQLIGEKFSDRLPSVPLYIRRPGFQSPSGELITRVRIRQVVREKNLYVADILTDWTQSPPEVGDIAFFN